MDMERPDKRPEFGTQEFGRKKDWFLTYDDKQRVWQSLAAELGVQWQSMDREEKDRLVAKYTDTIIDEVVAMAGGIWEGLSLEEKRELFHARFIDKTVPAGEREAAMADTPKEEFPDMDIWLLKNRDMMFGMTPKERESAYKTAKAKWEKMRNT